MGRYGDIYDETGAVIVSSYLDGIRSLCGNPRPEVIPNDLITAARASASERVERLTRRYNLGHAPDEVELYNLMSMATNLFASVYIMGPFNDKVEVRKINELQAIEMCKSIGESEDPADPTTDPSAPIVTSNYATKYLAKNRIGDGIFQVTNFGG